MVHFFTILFYFLFIFQVILLQGCVSKKFTYQTGDLIFQDLDCALCNAIEHATVGYNNKPISHMGIIYLHNDSIFVIEAYDSVQLTPLKNFLHRSSRIIIGRLKPPYRSLISPAINSALKKIGLPYDDEFALNNGKYYCSELVYEVFRDKEGKPLFDLIPMNFNNLSSGLPDSIWVDYFQKLHRPIPQGKPGSNPAYYSRNKKLDIIYSTY